jgi:hypothetical protein
MGRINRRKKHIAIRIAIKKREKVRKLLARAAAADPKEREVLLKKVQSRVPYTVSIDTLAGRK